MQIPRIEQRLEILEKAQLLANLELIERIEKLEVCDREDAKCWASVRESMHRLRERIEALEQRPIPGTVELATPTPEVAPVATDEELLELAGERFPYALRSCYDLGRQHGAAQPPAPQPAPPAAPAGGLVERVVKVIADPEGPAELWRDDARAAIREVAAWMRENETGYNADRLLEQEAQQ